MVRGVRSSGVDSVRRAVEPPARDQDERHNCPIADLDGDCTVGDADLAILLSVWGTGGSPADLDGNGVVDGPDLTRFLSAWS
ncbi:MAG: hypothetical protein ACO4BU_09270 [Phycisphaerales bacterium]